MPTVTQIPETFYYIIKNPKLAHCDKNTLNISIIYFSSINDILSHWYKFEVFYETKKSLEYACHNGQNQGF